MSPHRQIGRILGMTVDRVAHLEAGNGLVGLRGGLSALRGGLRGQLIVSLCHGQQHRSLALPALRDSRSPAVRALPR